jgi:4'-phosphopantetheinyl transferase
MMYIGDRSIDSGRTLWSPFTVASHPRTPFAVPKVMPTLSESVHVWKLDLDLHDAGLAAQRQVLDSDEIERANRFKFDALSRRFVAAHAGLRLIISGYTNVAAERLLFGYGEQGKPHLVFPPDTGIHFNLSHSGGGLAVVGVSRRAPLGIDIERIDDGIDTARVARDYFAAGEANRIARAPEAERQAIFFSYWTCKESFIKACGGGMSIPLADFEISPPAPGSEIREVVERGRSAPDWYVREFSPDPGYVGALAVDNRDTAVEWWQWSWSDTVK